MKEILWATLFVYGCAINTQKKLQLSVFSQCMLDFQSEFEGIKNNPGVSFSKILKKFRNFVDNYFETGNINSRAANGDAKLEQI